MIQNINTSRGICTGSLVAPFLCVVQPSPASCCCSEYGLFSFVGSRVSGTPQALPPGAAPAPAPSGAAPAAEPAAAPAAAPTAVQAAVPTAAPAPAPGTPAPTAPVSSNAASGEETCSGAPFSVHPRRRRARGRKGAWEWSRRT